jgi:hypothetical protein
MLGRERPREAGQRLARSDAAGPEAAPHEECRYVGARGNCDAHGPDAFRPPAVGQADHEQAGVTRCFEDAFFPGGDENRLGDDSNHLLHQQ